MCAILSVFRKYCIIWTLSTIIKEPQHDKTNKNDCTPSEDSDQPGHLPSLIRVFAVCMKKAWVLRYPLSAHRRLWSDWADAQADLSLRWAHRLFVGFVMRWLKKLWHKNLKSPEWTLKTINIKATPHFSRFYFSYIKCFWYTFQNSMM